MSPILDDTVRDDKSGGSSMKEHTKEIEEREVVTIDKVFMGFLFGVVAILSIWFLSGLFFVIFK